MNKEKKSFYDDNGYVILEKVFSDEEAEIFNNYMRRHANKKFSALINPDRYDSLLDQDERPKSDITLKEIKEMLKNCDYYDGKANVLKNRLERVMKTKCIDNKRFDNKKYRYAFIGYRWIDNDNNNES